MTIAAACFVTVEFTPTALGANQTALSLKYSDGFDDRVLTLAMTGEGALVADLVLGQTDLTSSAVNLDGGTATPNGLSHPKGVASDGTRLFVADAGNNRVLVWNAAPVSSGEDASYALGQPDLTAANANRGAAVSASTLNQPGGVFVHEGVLYVADTANNRVLIWDTMPTASGTPATRVLGQPTLDQNDGGTTSARLKGPTSVCATDSYVAVADQLNNRILVWNNPLPATGAAADAVHGQTLMTTSTPNNGGVNRTSMWVPSGIHCDSAGVSVADSGNHRVLIPISPPNSVRVVGQQQSTVNAENSGLAIVNDRGLSAPQGLTADDTSLVVADSGNHRVLIFDLPVDPANSKARLLIGQTAFDRGDPNGDANAATPGSLASPHAVTLSDGYLYVTDKDNNRILRIPLP